jgi:hypothetical protein
MEEHMIEIITGAASLIIGTIVGFMTRGSGKKVDRVLTIVSIFIVLLIGSHINSRIETNRIKTETQQIHELTKFYVQFKENPDAINIARKDLIVKELTEGHQFLREIYNSKKKRYKKNLETFGDLKIHYNITDLAELGEMQKDATTIFELAGKNTRIRATSYVNTNQWWNNEFGIAYAEANKNARNRGAEIERVWIIKSKKELTKTVFKKILETEKAMKIKSYYVLEKDIQNLGENKIDIIIVTSKRNENAPYYGELNLNLWRKMISVTFASNIKRLNKLENYWDELMKVAKEY